MATRLRTRVPAWAGVMSLTVASQGIAALSLLSVKALGGADADQYALGLQLGLAAFTGVSVGVVYNLAVGRPHWQHWQRAAWISAVLEVLLMGGLLAAAFAEGWGLNRQFADVVIAFGVGGAALALGGVYAVRLSCIGRPGWLVVMSVPANLSLGVGVGLVVLTGWNELIPALLWMGGAIVSAGAAVMKAGRIRGGVPVDVSGGNVAHALFLGVGIVASTVVPLAVIAAASQLPAGSMSTLLIVSRIVGSVVGLGVNSLLLVHYRWGEDRIFGLRLVIFAAPSGFLALLGAVIVNALRPAHAASYVLIVVAWATLAIASAIVLRGVNALRLSGVLGLKVAIDLVASATALAVFSARPSVLGFFTVFVVSQAVTLAVCSFGLRQHLTSFLAALSLPLAFIGLVI